MDKIDIAKVLKLEKIGKILAYVWVSAIEQNSERQNEILSTYKIDRIFVYKVSGVKLERP